MTNDLQEAQQARQLAENQLATLTAKAEALAMEHTVKLLESPAPVVVPWSDYPGMDDFNRWPSSYELPYYWTDLQDRIEGRYLPLYQSEQDLRRIRADARRLYNLFPPAQGAVQALGHYTMAEGFDFVVKAKDESNRVALGIAPLVQGVVDRFLEHNGFQGDFDRQVHDDSRVDGEIFAGLYLDGPHVRIDLIDPDCVLQPANSAPLERHFRLSHKLNYWWHGVHTQYSQSLKRDDVMRPLGYHCVFDKHGDQWDYMPSCRVEHIKRNVGRGARRGVSDFLIVLRDLENEAKIRRNTAEGAAILAAIVMIRQHAEGASRSSVEAIVAGNSTNSYVRDTPDRSFRQSAENVRPGTVKDIPPGMTHALGPMGTLRSPVYIEVAQYLLRTIGSRWNMPEYLISGDASNANYSSTLVAEGPFVKAREHDQARYAAHFESLIWKALAMYFRGGAFPGMQWEQIYGLLDIHAEYSSPASRDKKEQADVNQILHDNGILSKRTWAADSGLDLDEEIANGAAEKAPEPSPFGGGMFGQGPPKIGAPKYEAIPARLLQLAESCFK